MNENKVPCGGFRIGDSLTMEGDTLKSLGWAYIKVVPDEESPGNYKIADDSPLNYETAMKYDGFIFIKLYITGAISIVPLVEKYTKLLLFNIYLVNVSEHIMYCIAIEVHEDNSITLRDYRYTLTPAT